MSELAKMSTLKEKIFEKSNIQITAFILSKDPDP